MKELKSVRFLKPWNRYNVNDVAGLEPKVADKLAREEIVSFDIDNLPVSLIDNPNEIISVIFQKDHGSYVAGDIAGFIKERASRLCSGKHPIALPNSPRDFSKIVPEDVLLEHDTGIKSVDENAVQEAIKSQGKKRGRGRPAKSN